MPHRILVVDDEPDLELLISQRFRKRIRSNELDFLFAGNGEEALQRLDAHRDVDVVLTDINMPVMDGLTLLSKLREHHPTLRSVIVSAYGDMPNIRAALNRGAFDFLTKPIDFPDLEITLDRTIQEASALKQAASTRDELLSLQRELDVARRIQKSLVPQKYPPFPERQDIEIFGHMAPAEQVGGDLFDFFFLDNDRLGMAVGDVSGKGVASALYMAVCRTLLRSTAMKGLRPAECLHEVNRMLSMEKASSMFVTCFYGVLDTRSGEVTYSNGGHQPPFVIKASGEVETTELTGGLALGMFSKAEYRERTFRLERGDGLLLFTDGVTEAMNAEKELFSDERLLETVRRLNGGGVEIRVECVFEAVREYVSGAPQSDDMTALAVTWKGRG
jgi:sigma-B regulation protein RsbU (phosphoserine phosphatase)